VKVLKTHLDDYLKLRRQLGYKLVVAGMLLRSFVRFAEQEGAKQISTKLALRWATLPSKITQVQKANRLGFVRRFAQYVSTLEPGTEVPAQKLIPYQFRRQDPYHYSEENVVQLVKEARRIDPGNKIKGPTLGTLFGLLAVTGMRVGEAMALEREDVNLKQGILTLRHAKGNKVRLVPLHPSTVQALEQYACLRDELYPRPTSPTFFVWEGGVRLLHCTIHRWFLLVACQVGLRKAGGRRGPRIHDLRHYFAIRTLLNWYRSDVDVEVRLPELATYLGHVHVRDSYWYLSAVPQLLKLATLRWERAEKGGK
jgi:integrase/recombinase XerD